MKTTTVNKQLVDHISMARASLRILGYKVARESLKLELGFARLSETIGILYFYNASQLPLAKDIQQ